MRTAGLAVVMTFLGAAFFATSQASAQALDYTKPDWVSPEPPPNPAAVVTIPEFPQANRKFSIKRSGRGSGAGDVLRVADGSGRLDILDGGKLVQYVSLSRCFGFARMDDNHDWAKNGKPQFATAPPDCKVWDGRKWAQTYKTQMRRLNNPCYYQPEFTAKVSGAAGNRIVEVSGNGPGLVYDTKESFQVRTFVRWEEGLGFFRLFNVGYVGQIEVVNEIK